MERNAAHNRAVFDVRTLLLALSALLLVHIGIGIGSGLALYADAGHELLVTLLEAETSQWSLPRGTGHTIMLVTRLPARLLLTAGVTDLDTLRVAHGIGVFGKYAVMLAICALAARTRPALLLFPLASFFLVSANVGLFAWHRSNVAVALYWPMLFLLLVPPRWNPAWALAAPFLAILTAYSYESIVVLGVILVGAAIWRARNEQAPLHRFSALLSGALIVVGIVMAVISIPGRGGTEEFTSGLLFPFTDGHGGIHGNGLLSVAALALIAVSPWIGRMAWQWVSAALAVACAAWLAATVLWPDALFRPPLQHVARPLNLTLILALTVLFVPALLLYDRWRPLARRRALVAVGIIGVMQTAWFGWAAFQWQDFLRRLELATSQAGLIPYEGSPIQGHPYVWVWTPPLLSVLTAPDGNVRGIVAYPATYNGWVPFDPEVVQSLPKLERFGIRYDAYVAARTGRADGLQ